MIKAGVLFVSGILFASAAVASPSLMSVTERDQREVVSTETQKTYFADLKEKYDAGRMPTVAEVTGWFAGRCFDKSSEMTASNQMLAGVMRMEGNDRGPLYPSRPVLKLMSIVSKSQPANYYDEMTSSKEQQSVGVIDREWNSITEATETQGSLASQNVYGNLEYRIRISGEYLIEQATVIRDGGGYREGEVYSMCYFFKRLK